MTVQIKNLSDYGFFLSLLGGIITIVMALVGVVLQNTSDIEPYWLLGAGYIGFFSPVAGIIISIFLGALAIFLGLILYAKKINKMFMNWDLLILAIFMLIIGLTVLGIGGLLVLVGGILLIVHRQQAK